MLDTTTLTLAIQLYKNKNILITTINIDAMGRMKEKFMQIREQGVINYTPYTNDMLDKDENLILRSFIEISLRDLDVIVKHNQPGENENICQQTLEYIESRKKQLNKLLVKIEKLTK